MTASLEKKVWVEICLHQHSIICRELYFAMMVENKVGHLSVKMKMQGCH